MMNWRPKFFRLVACSRLYAASIRAIETHFDEWASRYSPGAIPLGVEGSTVWSPTISSLGGILIVQRPLADEMRAAGLAGLDECYPVNLREDWPSKIHQTRLSNAPEYVWFRIKRDILLDPAGLAWPPNHPLPNRSMPYRKVPLPGTHGGSDVFGVRGKTWTSLFCTFRFLLLARQKKWKGFSFEPMDVPDGLHFSVVKSISHLAKEWPPERWYPEGVEGHPNNLETQ